jgi:hypothetical protein
MAATVVRHRERLRRTMPADCIRCGNTIEDGADQCACGSFGPRNQVARKEGFRAVHHPPDLRMTSEELVSGVVSDLGGDSELSTLERSYVRKLGDLEITIRLATSDIARAGMLTPGGRVRDSYTALLSGIDRFDRLAMRLGLKRRAKPAATLAEVLAAHEDEPSPSVVDRERVSGVDDQKNVPNG